MHSNYDILVVPVTCQRTTLKTFLSYFPFPVTSEVRNNCTIFSLHMVLYVNRVIYILCFRMDFICHATQCVEAQEWPSLLMPLKSNVCELKSLDGESFLILSLDTVDLPLIIFDVVNHANPIWFVFLKFVTKSKCNSIIAEALPKLIYIVKLLPESSYCMHETRM